MKKYILPTLTFLMALSAQAQLQLELSFTNSIQVYGPVPLRPGVVPRNNTLQAVMTIPLLQTTPSPVVNTRPSKTKQPSAEPTQVSTSTTSPAVVGQVSAPTETKLQMPKWYYEAPQKLGEFQVRRFKTPPVLTLLRFKPVEKPAAVGVFKGQNIQTVLPVIALDKVNAPEIKPTSYSLEPLIEISSDEYKFLQALLLFDIHKKYESAMSLFIDLMASPQFKTQAEYHYALIAGYFDLKSEFRYHMLNVAKTERDADVRRKAIEQLTLNGKAVEVDDVSFIDQQIEELRLAQPTSPAYLIRRGQHGLKNANLKEAAQALQKIAVSAEEVTQARLLMSSAYYRLGDLNNALSVLEAISAQAARSTDPSIRNLYYLTVARLYFQKSQYKPSYQSYLKIDKNSGFWLQSSIEQATAQIMAGDYVGAAGNMFSLHTDYFKKAYAPDSYIIRAAGYLNLCQFGDAVTVVAELQRRYTQLNQQIQSYAGQHSTAQDYYQLVRSLFQNPDQADVNGVNRAFVVELARSPQFMSLQKRINAIENEDQKFKQIPSRFAAQAQNARQQINAIQKQQAQKKNTDTGLAQKILALESEIQILNTSRDKIERMRSQALVRQTAEKEKIKISAAAALQERFKDMQKVIADIMEQKDLLAYEIYSGAGEHLRYQMAGGSAPERAPAKELTPEEKQSYRWKFKGEVWEDEIGHYRSSLTNVCPKEELAKANGGKNE